FCKFYPDYDGCKAWLKKNLPDQFSQLDIGSDKEDGDEESKKRQKRGGKGMMKPKEGRR
ncbi:Density-regulated protein, partial [Caligus rogercresseyi]